jgi:hypothetical protein
MTSPVMERKIQWTRGLFADLEPHQTGVYLNFLDRDEQDRVPMAYAESTYRRLSAIKVQYDPDNVFWLNQSIRPPDRDAERGGPAAVKL